AQKTTQPSGTGHLRPTKSHRRARLRSAETATWHASVSPPQPAQGSCGVHLGYLGLQPDADVYDQDGMNECRKVMQHTSTNYDQADTYPTDPPKISNATLDCEAPVRIRTRFPKSNTTAVLTHTLKARKQEIIKEWLETG